MLFESGGVADRGDVCVEMFCGGGERGKHCNVNLVTVATTSCDRSCLSVWVAAATVLLLELAARYQSVS